MTYAFSIGDRVYCLATGKYGEVITMVPGNGKDAWYFVQHEDGSKVDRYMAGDLERA